MVRATAPRKRPACEPAQPNEDESGYDLFFIGPRPSLLLQSRIELGLGPETVQPYLDDLVAGLSTDAAAMWCMYDSVPDYVFHRFELARHGVDPNACSRPGYKCLRRIDESTFGFVSALPDPYDGTVAVVRVTAFGVPGDCSRYDLHLEMLKKVPPPPKDGRISRTARSQAKRSGAPFSTSHCDRASSSDAF